MKIQRETTSHYTWGRQCEGWHFVKSPSLSVIAERMPPGTTETLHYHKFARQLFYIISGMATFILEGAKHEVHPGEGFYIEPMQQHSIQNNGQTDLHFLVISEPMAQGDRYEKNNIYPVSNE